jgi:peptidoglycan/xylan/chitin deacetylase (PgdA/CDA1 family)
MKKEVKNLKRKYILAIFFIAIAISFCGTAAAADTSSTTLNDQVTTSSVQDNPTADTPGTSTTQNNVQDTQSDTNTQTTANDQATSTTPTTTASSTQNAVQDTQSDTNTQTTQNVVSSVDPVVMTFDDGLESTYTIAYPIMQKYGIVGTVYVVPSWVGHSGYLTLEQLTELHDAGWTIASHTWDHQDLTTLSIADIDTELQSTIDWLNLHGFTDGAYQLAYPYGNYNDTVVQEVSKLGIKTARTVEWGTITSDGQTLPFGYPLNYLALPVIEVRSDTAQIDWQTELDRSILGNGTTIFLIHDIHTGAPIYVEDITPVTFETIIKYVSQQVVQKGIKTLTISQWYNYNFDKVEPTVIADLQSGIFNKLKSVTLTAADNLDTNPFIYYSTDNGLTWNKHANTVIIDLNEGISTLMFYVMDNAGNTCTTQTNTYTINTKMPIVTADLSSGIYNSLKSVTLNAEDNLDKNPCIYYSIDNGLTWNKYANTVTINLNEGITSLMYYSKNSADNTCPTLTNTYTIDTILPTASDNLNTGLYNTNKLVTLSMNEPGSIYYSLNGGTPNTLYTGPISISWTCNLIYNAVDVANNPSPIYSKTYTFDKVAPKVSKISPTNRKTGISRTSYIYIKFSEKFKKSVNWSKIRVKNLKTGKYLSIKKYSSGNLLKIKTSKRSSKRWYQVIVPLAAIQDNAGNNLKTTYTFKFKTKG